MKDEALLIDTKPSGVILVPHLCMLIIIVGFFTVWKPLKSFLGTNLRVTTKRVTGKNGIVKTESLDSPITKVTSVKVEQSLFGKILNYGTIYINTPAGNFEFNYIPDVEKIKDIIIEHAN